MLTMTISNSLVNTLMKILLKDIERRQRQSKKLPYRLITKNRQSIKKRLISLLERETSFLELIDRF